MGWTHLICVACWNKRKPAAILDKEYDNAPSEPCCFCDQPTTTGIYVREDGNKIMCKGEHD